MSGEPQAVRIPDDQLRAIFAEARRAFPHECCGWTTDDGVRPCANAQGTSGGDHPTAPERGAETAYVIAGADLLELARSLDGPNPPRIIYHSHPNGRAYFSATDREVATSPWGDGPAYPVEHLVVGVDGARVTEAALFAWSDDAGGWIEVARW